MRHKPRREHNINSQLRVGTPLLAVVQGTGRTASWLLYQRPRPSGASQTPV